MADTWDEGRHPRDPHSGEWTRGTHALPGGRTREAALRAHLAEQHGTSAASDPHLREPDLAWLHQAEHGKKNSLGIVSEQQVEDSHSIDAAGNIIHKHTARRGGRTVMADGLRLGELLARTALTGEASTTHKPFGKPSGPGLWHHKGLQLPPYIQHVAHHLVASGHSESEAIEMAVGIVKNWAAGHDGKGSKVHPDVQAAASKNIAQWEADKAKAGRSAVTTMTERAVISAADQNDLPDSAFAFIESGGTHDSSGKTVPRSLRHFPIQDEAHARNALAQLTKSDLSGADQAKALTKIKAAAKKFGIEVSDGSGTGNGSASRGEIFRYYPLDDIRVMRAADGEPSGRVVEAYATVFDEPAEIHDAQGHYMEVIDRGAFDKVLARISRTRGGFGGAVRVLFNHGKTMEGVPAPEFQRPIGKALDIRPDGRGLLTRTEYAKKPFAEEILDDIREGRITGQSFVGGIHRSDPELRGPGDKYRGRGGALTTVRRLALGLREYGPVLYGAYTGAEFLGVRMATPGTVGDYELDLTEDEDDTPDTEGDATGGTPEDVTSARYHAHRLLALRIEEICRETGIGPLRSQW